MDNEPKLRKSTGDIEGGENIPDSIITGLPEELRVGPMSDEARRPEESRQVKPEARGIPPTVGGHAAKKIGAYLSGRGR